MEFIPPPIRTKRRIKRFDPIQLGKMLAAIYGILGLIYNALAKWIGGIEVEVE